MRKLTSILTIAFLAISVSVCAQNAKKGKALVAYFSASGNTEAAAKKIQEAAGADLYKIEPEKPYTKEDLDFRNRQARSVVEMGSRNMTSFIWASPSGQTRHPASSILSSSHRTSRERPSFLLPHQAAAPSTTRSTSSKPLTQN